jgi:hypothetical protein
MAQKLCLFCQLPLAGKSEEHVLPQWLLNHLAIGNEDIRPTHFTAEGNVVSTRRHKLRNLVEGSVCSNCNNGWMSRLENDAKPILIPLMAGTREVVQLNKEERLLLARWTCKTCYVLNTSSNYHPKVPSNHLEYVHQNEKALPNNVAVVAQQQQGGLKFYWWQQQFFMKSDTHPYVTGYEEAQRLLKPSYKISLLLNKLLLLVAYWPWPAWRMVLWPGIHIPLWPHSGTVGWYHQDPLTEGFPWFDSLRAIHAFHQTFGIVRED